MAAWNNFGTICGIASCDVNRGCSLACQQGLLPLRSGVSAALAVRLPLAVMGLDVIPSLAPMCWDVVGKLIADILGL